MDDLISREAAKAEIRNKFKSIAERCEINEVLNSVPTVDAITVEWLRGLMIVYANINTPEHAACAYCLNNVIEEWQKEQEAHNGQVNRR